MSDRDQTRGPVFGIAAAVGALGGQFPWLDRMVRDAQAIERQLEILAVSTDIPITDLRERFRGYAAVFPVPPAASIYTFYRMVRDEHHGIASTS